MANRVPLVVDTSTLYIKELPTGDNLDLTGSGIVGLTGIAGTTGNFSGIVTASAYYVDATQVISNGRELENITAANITGITTTALLNVGVGGTIITTANTTRVGINSTSPQTTLDIGGTASIKVPVGTTAERPGSANAGFVRFNTDLNTFEGYNGAEWGGLGGASEKDTAVATTSPTTCDTFAVASHRSASIVAQITQGSNYQVGKYLIIHDGSTASVIEESALATGSMLGTFTVTISGGDVLFQVNMTSASAATVTTLMTKVSV
jgi:hydrogenase maturation factor